MNSPANPIGTVKIEVLSPVEIGGSTLRLETGEKHDAIPVLLAMPDGTIGLVFRIKIGEQVISVASTHVRLDYDPSTAIPLTPAVPLTQEEAQGGWATPRPFPEADGSLGKPADWDDAVDGECGALPFAKMPQGLLSCWHVADVEARKRFVEHGNIWLQFHQFTHPVTSVLCQKNYFEAPDVFTDGEECGITEPINRIASPDDEDEQPDPHGVEPR